MTRLKIAISIWFSMLTACVCLAVGGNGEHIEASLETIHAQQDYIFHHLSTDDGLSNSCVQHLLRDKEGFLWIGTSAGLNRYDGYRFRVFTHGVSTDNDIWSLQEDSWGRIWAGRYGDYYLYDREIDDFRLEGREALAQLGITVDKKEPYQVFIDKQGDMFVFTSNKMTFYSSAQSKAVYSGRMPYAWQHRCLEIYNYHHQVFSIDRQCHLCVFDKKKLSFTVLPLSDEIKKSMLGKHCYVFLNSKGELYLYANESGDVYRCRDIKPNNDAEWSKVLSSTGNHVTGMAETADGSVWISTDHKGVFVLNPQSESTINLRHNAYNNSSIAQDNINTIYADSDGTVWLGTFKRGLSYFNTDCSLAFRSRAEGAGDVISLLCDSKGRVWIGTDGNGLWCETGGTLQHVALKDMSVMSIIEDRRVAERIWIGTYQDGIYMMDHNHLTHIDAYIDGMRINNTWTLAQDLRGNIYTGSALSQLVKYDIAQKKWQKLNISGNNDVRPLSIFTDDGNTLYICTVCGLLIMNTANGHSKMYYGNAKGDEQFKNQFISSVYRDKHRLLWIAHNKGLTVWDTLSDHLYYLDTNAGLGDEIIQAMSSDADGTLWASTSNGLSAIATIGATSTSKPRQLTFNINHYTNARGGLHENYMNVHACCKMTNGSVAMGTAEGYTIIVKSQKHHLGNNAHPLHFTTLMIGQKEVVPDSLYRERTLLKKNIDCTSVVKLRYDDYGISIGFTTNDLANPNDVTYAYRLSSINNDWIYTNSGKAEFTSLHPGEYTLHVKACRRGEDWSEERTLKITVAPPFYRSTAAYIVYCLLFAVAIGYIYLRIRQKYKEQMRQQEAMLKVRKAELEMKKDQQLNEMKLRFFTNISHDLRTPLTLIISPLQQIVKADEANPNKENTTSAKNLRMVLRNAESLLQLVNSLLDFRKAESGTEPLHLQKADLVQVVSSAAFLYKSYAAEHRISLTVVSGLDSLYMPLDIDKTQKIVNNLLSNAIKFTLQGGSVEIDINREEGLSAEQAGSAIVRISDTGCGISDEAKPHLFEYYYQQPTASRHSPQPAKGTGIGLAIVKEYIDMLGGSISVADNHPQGTVFTVTLPIQGKAEEPEAMPNEMVAADTAKPENLADRPTILFVDDNADLRTFVQSSLSDEYLMLTASNATEALSVLESDDSIEVVVSDVMMPDIDGYELCRRIKSNIQTSHIPVLLLTARADDRDRIEGLTIGADDYLTKPFNLDILRLRIHKFIEWAELRHKRFRQKIQVSPSEITITPLDEQFIAKAVKDVEDHFSDSTYSVEQLGQAVGLSRSHLYKKILRITGKSPMGFIRTLKMKRACMLLQRSGLQIAEVGYAVGYNTPKRFTENFKEEFGMTPTEYLKSINNNENNPD